jgi:putative permease
MIEYLREWYRKHFANNEAAVFMFVAIFSILVIIFLGGILAPIFASIVIAFLLESIVKGLQKYTKISRGPLVITVYMIFLAIVLAFIFVLLPMLFQQLISLLKAAPQMIGSTKTWLYKIANEYPNLISHDQINETLASLSGATTFEKLATYTKDIIDYSISSLSSIFSYIIYLFLVPLLVLFFLKDKDQIIKWFLKHLPQERGALVDVWSELKPQLANYMKGKALEMFIVTIATYIGFVIFHLDFAILLAVCVGFSVVIPYVGMVLVTVPVIIVGLMQFGISTDFVYMFIIYLIIQGLDGNLLVPILYSEAVNLHPVAVIAAVLFFGSIWGFWGLFFAIPLAALAKAGIKICTGENDKKLTAPS